MGNLDDRAGHTAGQQLARFGHHPDPAIDFCEEVEQLESIAANARMGLTGFGHEEDRETLDARIGRAMTFRVGGDANAVQAKATLRELEKARAAIAKARQP